MKRASNKSKRILTKILVLYEHLDRLMDIPKPRPNNVNMLIDAVHEKIEQEKKKLRNTR